MCSTYGAAFLPGSSWDGAAHHSGEDLLRLLRQSVARGELTCEDRERVLEQFHGAFAVALSRQELGKAELGD